MSARRRHVTKNVAAFNDEGARYGDEGMRLYNSFGPNPKVVRVIIAENGNPIPLETVDLRAGVNRQEVHLKRNPNGQTPTLELDDGSYLSEITAICEYLDDKYPRLPLIGSLGAM
jgi:glutathione S-transferase